MFSMYIDVSDVVGKLMYLSGRHEVGVFHAMMQRTFMETGRHARPVIKREILKEYEVKSSWVDDKLGQPRPLGTELGCLIPIKSKRGAIGGIYVATGGMTRVQGTVQHMRDGTTRNRKAHWRVRRINAKIVKGQQSTMPELMAHQGGNPPFRNGMAGVAFTRTTKARLPIASVVGLGVPQMPINRSRPAIEADIKIYLMKRLQHNYERLILGGL
ncbi:MAG: hypothetical protein IJ523_10500 [Succinivibrionaceae bacterium]|nr:hypothetical protein [Succinivibrionaceae bacterium]